MSRCWRRTPDTYLQLRTELAEDAVTSDPVLTRITAEVTAEWEGTSAELLDTITPAHPDWKPPKDWPTPRKLTTMIRRRAPSLRRLGWTVDELDEKDPAARAVRFRLSPPPDQRRPVRDARDARTLASEGVSAAQGTRLGASDSTSDSPGCERRSSDDARDPHDARHVARTPTPPPTSDNGSRASDASVTSDEYAQSQVADTPRCAGCGQPLLLRAVGRDTCERCRRERAAS